MALFPTHSRKCLITDRYNIFVSLVFLIFYRSFLLQEFIMHYKIKYMDMPVLIFRQINPTGKFDKKSVFL